jgi:class 3 adenylate cyclase
VDPRASTEPVRGLPSGSVTFVMSDIEGSTRLFQRWGSAYVPLLAEHRTLLRDAVSRHDGVEVDTEGDGVLSAFP